MRNSGSSRMDSPQHEAQNVNKIDCILLSSNFHFFISGVTTSGPHLTPMAARWATNIGIHIL